MAKITYISHAGEEMVADIAPGYSLMEGAVGNGIDGIDAVCGGNCYCGTCRVYVDAAWRDKMGAMLDFEKELLEANGDDVDGVRLSCQIKVTEAFEGLILRLPEKQV
jgi:2Fe-2S ferredoxin